MAHEDTGLDFQRPRTRIGGRPADSYQRSVNEAHTGASVTQLSRECAERALQSTFSARFAAFGRDLYRMFVPDVMHEFDLGVWKSGFTHLLRVLASLPGDGLQKLDARSVVGPGSSSRRVLMGTYRYSRIRTFGRDTIRKFGTNSSAMQQFAARDFEQHLKVGDSALTSST